jgi:ankyrin repeat protein
MMPDDWLMKSIAREDWKQTELAIKQDPLNAMTSAKVKGFLGSDKICKITPMHQACAHKAPLELIELIHDLSPTSLQTRDSVYMRLPLHVALMTSESPMVVFKLLDLHIASAQGKDILGRYPLHYACHHAADPTVVEALVVAYPLAISHTDANGWLPIHVACRFDMPVSVIRLLLGKYPSSVHKKTDKGSTPIMCAKKNNHQELLELLKDTADATPEDLDEMVDLDLLQQECISTEFVDLHASGSAGMDLNHSNSSFNGSATTISTTPSSNMVMSPKAHRKSLHRDELARLAYSSQSPYAITKKAKIPFLGTGKVELDV